MIAVHKTREAIRLLFAPQQLSHSEIGRILGMPRQTIDDTCKRATDAAITSEMLDTLDDDELQHRMYPKFFAKKRLKVEPPYQEIIKECFEAHKKYRKTIWVKYCEYKQKFGDKGYKPSRFYQLIAEHVKSTRLSMLQISAPGEVMYIDYAGSTVSHQEDGKTVTNYVFVATLGYSTKRFLYATKDMTAESWINAIIAAIDFFGGMAEVIHCDNARAMVKTPGLLAELSNHAREFAKYSNVHIDTSDVFTPGHNFLAENRVKELTHSVIATANTDLTFFSRTEINDYFKAEVEKRNNTPHQKTGLSANRLFYADEYNQLRPKPKRPFEIIKYRTVIKVPENYFVYYEGNRYSVPHQYSNDYVELRATSEQLKIYYKGQLRVVHDIVQGKNNVVSIDEHLHPRHRAQKNKTKPHYLSWAKTLDNKVVEVVEHFYSKTRHNHSRPVGKQCQALQKLQQKYGDQALISACEYAINFDMVTPTEIELILRAKTCEPNEYIASTKHQNLRGQDYYGEM
ncbi:transposase [Endozoicomonas sp. G2_1]|uniref:Mu transposase domain-containing protein n=1 Tax=Endozoicomonas sp. G2_1 TaxID=2821091 RepID=UPI001ADCAB45|nr:DDE-type integrase/transposase/recombinase [Endozoicomonas sp. G2_1]MBO9492024.1 transposase [Endozoicomonas sp. G2_1]